MRGFHIHLLHSLRAFFFKDERSILLRSVSHFPNFFRQAQLPQHRAASHSATPLWPTSFRCSSQSLTHRVTIARLICVAQWQTTGRPNTLCVEVAHNTPPLTFFAAALIAPTHCKWCHGVDQNQGSRSFEHQNIARGTMPCWLFWIPCRLPMPRVLFVWLHF